MPLVPPAEVIVPELSTMFGAVEVIEPLSTMMPGASEPSE